MPISSRVGLTHPESWHKVSERGYLGLFFYRVRKKGSFEVLLVFFSTFSSQNLKYPTLMHWLASWVNPTSKTHIPCLPTTSQVSPVQFSLDSVALNFRPKWWHGPSLKHCAGRKLCRHTAATLLHVFDRERKGERDETMNDLQKGSRYSTQVPYRIIMSASVVRGKDVVKYHFMSENTC